MDRNLLLIVLLLGACSDAPVKSNVQLNNDPDASNNTTADTGGDAGNQECTDPAPGCGTCSAAVCTDGVWECLGTPCAQQCPDAPPNCGSCEAQCLDSEWQCVGDSCDFECSPTNTSNLPGASINFDSARCSWTLAEAAAGILIPYTVEITEANQVVPESQQNGCDEPGDSGLGPFERIYGAEEAYCLCDVGLCAPNTQSVDLEPGAYEFAVAWDGVNWNGPSDTGNPKGEAFPPGEYTVEVRAIGSLNDSSYEVVGQMQILLTP